MQASKEAQEKQEALLAAVEARRAVKQTVVPTNKADIIAALRTIGEPVTLFGEGVVSLRSSAPEGFHTELCCRGMAGHFLLFCDIKGQADLSACKHTHSCSVASRMFVVMLAVAEEA